MKYDVNTFSFYRFFLFLHFALVGVIIDRQNRKSIKVVFKNIIKSISCDEFVILRLF